VERIRPDYDSEDLRWASQDLIDRIIQQLRIHRDKGTETLELGLSVLPRELRHKQIESAWKKRHLTFEEEALDWLENESIESIYGYEPEYFKLKVDVTVDYKRKLAELSVEPSPTTAKMFVGDIEQVENILELFKIMMAVPIEDGDKAEFYLCDEHVQLSIDLDLSQEVFDVDYGWSPASPEGCSDDERDTFFPNDR
jgi:hypothetical protein